VCEAGQEETRDASVIEIVTVTAQKQEENVQDVAMGITVLNKIDIEDKKIESLIDMANFVPNLMLFNHGVPGLTTPTTRGVSAPATSLSTSTGLFIDGVPILMAPGFEDDLLDVERIEILRGPQGTIYGTGTEAGVISVITRQPGNEFRGKVSAQLGEDSKEQYTLSLSGPIVKDKLFFGLAGNFYQKDGFMEHTVTGNYPDNREHWSTRTQLRWTPTDRVEASLIVSHMEENSGMGHSNIGVASTSKARLPKSENRKTSANEDADGATPESDLQALKVALNFTDALTLTSVTTNWLHKDYAKRDMDGTMMFISHTDKKDEHKKVSQEIRLDYVSDTVKWLVGLYGDKAENDIDITFKSMIPSRNGVNRKEIDGDTYAVFANLTFPVSKKFNVTTGARYETESLDYKDTVQHVDRDDTWDSFTPKAALEYHFDPELMTYASVSKGYRSGGFNWAAPDPAFNIYDQEELWSYEVGVKSSFLDNRLIINGAVYHMDITDMQVSEGNVPINFITNAAEATSRGFELELMAKATPNFTLTAAYGYNDIEFDRFSDDVGDYKGNTAPFAPKYNFHTGAQYRHPTGIYARADLIGYGKMYLDKKNLYTRDAYELVNAKIGYETAHVDVYLYGKNIFDEEYDALNYFDGFWNLYSEPREIGVQVVCRF